MYTHGSFLAENCGNALSMFSLGILNPSGGIFATLLKHIHMYVPGRVKIILELQNYKLNHCERFNK